MTGSYKDYKIENIKNLVEELQITLNYHAGKEFDDLAHLLTRQSFALDKIFQRMLLDADRKTKRKGGAEYSPIMKRYLTALKAQDQCRKTVDEINHIIKNNKKLLNI